MGGVGERESGESSHSLLQLLYEKMEHGHRKPYLYLSVFLYIFLCFEQVERTRMKEVICIYKYLCTSYFSCILGRIKYYLKVCILYNMS